jgi:dihydropteroate synthase
MPRRLTPEPLAFRQAVFDGSRPWLVGILNLTPDSFSDGGRYTGREAALARAAELEAEGADVLDLGGESTRPGAQPVDAAEERRRVLPVLEALAGRTRCVISVDTSKAEVARAALAGGAEMVNDISGGRLDPELLPTCALAGAAVVVLGHLRGQPRTMQEEIRFDDVFAEVAAELAERVAAARAAGVRRLVVDPGIGFGKRGAHNIELIRRAGELGVRLGEPVMIGASRKSFLGELSGIAAPGERLVPSVVAAVAAAAAGAGFLRVHDVAATRQALRVFSALAPRVEVGA